MTYVLNTTASVLASEAASRGVAAAAHGTGFWQRLYTAIITSRARSAARELRVRSYLINEAEIVLGGFPQTTLADDARLPFNR
jgi:hypothetical protein